MNIWQPIDTAPKDGSILHVRRIHEGRVIYEGPAAWRTVHFEALPPHPLDGDVYAPRTPLTWWAYPREDKMVPTPTHWRPAKTV